MTHTERSREQISKVAIRAGGVVDGLATPLRRDVLVTIHGGRIAEVKDWPGDWPTSYERADLREYTVLPGLIDAHVHLELDPSWEGGTPPAPETREDRVLRAAAHAQVCLAAGITTIRDMGSLGTGVLSLRGSINAGALAGPRILASGPPITTTGGHTDGWLGTRADTADEVRRAARRLHKQGVDVFKIMVTGGTMTPGSMPTRSQYSVEEVGALVSEASRFGKTVAAHAIGTEGIRIAVAAGVTTIEHCSWLGEGETADFDEAVARHIVERGIFVNPTAGPLVESRRRSLETIPGLMAAKKRQVDLGTRITAGTDAGIPGARHDSLPENLSVMTTYLGMKPVDAIAAATSVSAASMRLQHEIGSISPGRLADLIVVSGDPTREIGVLANVAVVAKSGAIAAVRGRIVEDLSWSAALAGPGLGAAPHVAVRA